MKLSQYLRQKKLSRSLFAEKIGVATHTIDRYIAGRVPNNEVMRVIFKATKGKVAPNDFYQLK